MKPIFYSNIELEEGDEKGLVKIAHVLGYELVKFNGYSAEEIGWEGHNGTKRDEIKRNREASDEVLNAYAAHLGVENVHMMIYHTEPCKKCGKISVGCCQ